MASVLFWPRKLQAFVRRKIWAPKKGNRRKQSFFCYASGTQSQQNIRGFCRLRVFRTGAICRHVFELTFMEHSSTLYTDTIRPCCSIISHES